MGKRNAVWTYRTDAVSSGKKYVTPQAALDAAVRGGDWWRGAEKDGGWIKITDTSGHGFLDADELDAMLARVK